MEKMGKKQISLWISDETRGKLDELHIKKQKTMTILVELAVDLFYKKEKNNPKPIDE